MSDLIKITKDGIKGFSWKNKRYEEDTEVVSIWTHLRSACEICVDVTLDHIIEFAKKDQELRFIISLINPNFDFDAINLDSSLEHCASIDQEVNILNNVISVKFSTSAKLCSNVELVISNHVKLFKDGVLAYEGHSCFSFLDVLIGIFKKDTPPEEITLTKDNIKSQNNLINSIFKICNIENLQVEDIFDAVESDELLKTFLSFYSWLNVDELHKAAKQEFDEKAPGHNSFSFAYVYTAPKVSIGKRGTFIDVPPGGSHEFTLLETFDGISYSPAGVHPARLAKLPLKVDNDTVLTVDENKVITSHKCVYNFTLLEILDAIYFETGFYGT